MASNITKKLDEARKDIVPGSVWDYVGGGSKGKRFVNLLWENSSA